MFHSVLPTPGPLWGDYPERRAPGFRWHSGIEARLLDGFDSLCARVAAHTRFGDHQWLRDVHAAQSALAAVDEASAVTQVRALVLQQGLSREAITQGLALAAHLSCEHLNRQPFDTQLVAARAILECRAAEMATGEGKTLAVGLAAAVAAFAGMPVHVVTANDYLVQRDAEDMRFLYSAFGLSVMHITQATGRDARARAYHCDIVYVTAKEVVFDYLRDGLAQREAHAAVAGNSHDAVRRREPQRLLRGLCMAIIDEADAILIDEARIPLILSRSVVGPFSQRHAQTALSFARTLRLGVDFVIDAARRTVELTPAGCLLADRAADQLAHACASGVWRNRLHREHTICTALAALHCYQRDLQYLRRDGAIQIIDENTGRVAAGRVWSSGLHQLVETKEGCATSPETETVAQLTYQRFFRRYVRLGGLSGTLREVRGELLTTYGLRTRSVALRKPSQRRALATKIYADRRALWAAVIARVIEVHATGRPVLVATESVAEARHLAHLLTQRHLPHTELHASNDAEEALCVARAGQRGVITVTTNISGRGTDIVIGAAVAALGGLHIISCQLNGARRIDRQLAGRAGRQGDPGSVETLLSVEHPLLRAAIPTWLCKSSLAFASRLPNRVLRWVLSLPQRAEEMRHAAQRRRLIEEDEKLESKLAFAGVSE